MFFAHSRELYHCIIQNHGHCTSGSIVGMRPSTYAIKTQHLNFCPCGSSGGQLQSFKTLLATPLAPLLPLLASLAGTPRQQGRIQPNPCSRRLHRLGRPKELLIHILTSILSLPIFFEINHVMTDNETKPV